MSGVATAVVAGSVLTAGAGYLASQSASDASANAANASRQLSEQQFARAQEAAGRVPEFRPVTVTSQFGTPQYTYDASGRLTGVSSTPSSWLSPLQTRGQGLAGGYQNLQEQALYNTAGYDVANKAFGAAQNLYGQAAGALPTSYDTTQATQDYYTQMKGLLAADQERQLAATRNSVFQKGRQGLAMGATQAGGELATNPEMAAYYNALTKSDANLALDAKTRAINDLQARQTMGLGLLTAGGQQSAVGGNALNQYYGNLTTTQANAIADAYMRSSGAGGAAAQQAIGYDLQANSQNPWASLIGGAGSGLQNWGAIQSANARNDKLISAFGTRA